MARKSVVAAVDGSAASVQAAVLATRIADAAATDCRLVHVVRGPGALRAAVRGRAPLAEVGHEARRELTGVLRGRVRDAVLEGLEVRPGRPAAALVDAARRWEADLVVLGGKPHGALARGLGGSTAHRLLRAVDVPLLVTGPTERPMDRVLVALDLSPASRSTLRAARRLGELLGARIRVLHVVEPIRSPVGAEHGAAAEADYRTSEKALRRLVAAEPGGAELECVVRRGAAADEIAAEATSWGADVIALGSHGKSAVDRLLIGSVTERLLAELPTSLLVVPVRPASRGRTRRSAGRSRARTGERRGYAGR